MAQSVAIVTGAASGIGYAIAQSLGAAGNAVAIVDLDAKSASRAAHRVEQVTGARTLWQVADVTDIEACKSAHAKIVETLGPTSILINNAGNLVRQKGRLEDLPSEHFEETMAIHVNGSMNWARLVLPGMRRAAFGRIVNMSSVNAIAAVPYRLSYVTAKKAIRGATEALALETARAGITVNAIAPGYVLTDALKSRAAAGILDREAIAHRTPVGRWAEPDEIASAVAFLVSKEAGYITGSTLVVDGGLSIRGDSGEDLTNPPD